MPRMTSAGVVELRQYTLYPGTRETLVDLFDRELVEPQEAVGLRVIGQFRDLDRPDRFVWLRGFADLASRRRGLEAFYGGPAWAAHRSVANPTMIDFDDVRLLHPLTPDTGFAEAPPRPPVGAPLTPAGLATITVFTLTAVLDAAVSAVVLDLDAALTAAGAPRVALLGTEPAPNDYPALPVRTGEHVVVRVSRFDDPAAHTDHVQRARRTPTCVAGLAALQPVLAEPWHELRLEPTNRSLVR